MGLREYQRKRRFADTPEPASGGKTSRERIFVVQLHHASHRHYDFRLELDGVLKSWAVPKGPSFDPAVKRLAMEVEDHPLSYAGFEGDIPKGNYGAGHVDVFDHGTWEPIGSAHQGLGKGDLKFTLHGDVLRGEWVLVRTGRQGAKNAWLLIKHRDSFAGPREANDFVDPKTDRPLALKHRKKIWPGRAEKNNPVKLAKKKPLEGARSEALRNEAFAPELCKPLPEPPSGSDWIHEVKWDGYRIVATVVKGKARLWSRNAIEWTHKLPAVAEAIELLGLKSAQLDGEIILLKGERDDFNALQARLSNEGGEAPIVYMLFDMPYWNGKSLRDVPLVERKAVLARVLGGRPHPLLRLSEHQVGDGKAAFLQATKAGLEGIVSKRSASLYRGVRNGDWVKAKGRPSDEFVVLGFTEPKASRSGLGALLLGKYEHGSLVYAGRVGTGLSDRQLAVLRKQLQKDVISLPPATIDRMSRVDQKLAIWVKPRVVVEVFFQGIGGQGLLRQPAFKALRPDKRPADLMSVEPATAGRAKSAQFSIKHQSRRSKAEPRSSSAPTGEDVVITHPEREVFPGTGITKEDVATYYRNVAPWILPQIASRPLSVVRCPAGAGQACFFQKHNTHNWGAHVRGVSIRETEGKAEYLCIDDATGLLELVQMNVLELHPWGAMAADPEHADRVVFDLDPHPSVAWTRVRSAARDLRSQLSSIGLTSFLRTSGGKGLHVVVPLDPPATWIKVKTFAQAVAQAMAGLRPEEFVSIAGEKKRQGRIFIDWLRNGRGATSVASYSLRARAGAGIAMPIAWTALGRVKSGDAFTIRNAIVHLARRKSDPWAEMSATTQSLPKLAG
jgi:bifunctional non-homologous end joining protein LigD